MFVLCSIGIVYFISGWGIRKNFGDYRFEFVNIFLEIEVLLLLFIDGFL